MILYFSGLGNSRYIAHSIGKLLKEEVVDIAKLDPDELKFVGSSLGVVFPVYSWGVPPIVIEYVNRFPATFIHEILSRKVKCWMICTCGDDAGYTAEMLSETLSRRGLCLDGAWSVIMPNTYVLLPGFDVDDKNLEEKKLRQAQKYVVEIAHKVRTNSPEWKMHRGSFAYIKTKIIYPQFIKRGMNPQKWHFSSSCVKCGKCVNSCPISNISMGIDGPIWGTNCISCLACYHHCPTHAVEYGSVTKRKGQYVCPLNCE